MKCNRIFKFFQDRTLLRTCLNGKKCMLNLTQEGGHPRFNYFSQDDSITAYVQWKFLDS